MALFGRKEMLTEDAFVRTQKQLMTLPKEQAKEKIGELMKMCNCPNCPTYTECAKNAKEGLFCAMGQSFCNTENKGCICATCPVHKQLELKYQAFCLMGSEKDQRFDAMIR